MNWLAYLRCSLFHRIWHYGPVSGWPSSNWKECQVCGRTWASGIRSWFFYNLPKDRRE